MDLILNIRSAFFIIILDPFEIFEFQPTVDLLLLLFWIQLMGRAICRVSTIGQKLKIQKATPLKSLFGSHGFQKV